MSRIGRMPIDLPAGVQVRREGNKVTVKGPRGELSREFASQIDVAVEENQVHVKRPDDTRQSKALHGLSRALLANMVTGVSAGFTKRLVIEGVGFRADVQDSGLVLQVGYSHTVTMPAPEGIRYEVDRTGRFISVEGNDKELVGETAARIRRVRKPEPYKGKGIAYEGEVVRRKAGKAGRAGGK
ncbi:MAG: 50S ribosomal protein L6 [Chloroflexi bacterium]|nr:50S ribosomal protein L6 [Chloroflexota bacterium]